MAKSKDLTYFSGLLSQVRPRIDEGSYSLGGFHSAYVLRYSNDHLLPKYITVLLRWGMRICLS